MQQSLYNYELEKNAQQADCKLVPATGMHNGCHLLCLEMLYSRLAPAVNQTWLIANKVLFVHLEENGLYGLTDNS
jgi:hypothetical protein